PEPAAMGLLDVLRGRRDLKAPAPDRLFAMTTAYVTLDTELGLKTAGAAGIVFQALDTADFNQIATDMPEVVSATSSESGTKIDTSDASFGYRWSPSSSAGSRSGTFRSDAAPARAPHPAGGPDPGVDRPARAVHGARPGPLRRRVHGAAGGGGDAGLRLRPGAAAADLHRRCR